MVGLAPLHTKSAHTRNAERWTQEGRRRRHASDPFRKEGQAVCRRLLPGLELGVENGRCEKDREMRAN